MGGESAVFDGGEGTFHGALSPWVAFFHRDEGVKGAVLKAIGVSFPP